MSSMPNLMHVITDSIDQRRGRFIHIISQRAGPWPGPGAGVTDDLTSIIAKLGSNK